MRLTNLTTNQILSVDEYVGTGLLQFWFNLKPGQSTFVDGTLGKQSKQLSSFQNGGQLAVISTEATVSLTPPAGAPANHTITIDPDTGYTATVPLRVVVVDSADPVVAKIVSRTANTFVVKITTAAGAEYDLTTTPTAAAVQVYYEFGDHLNRKTY